MKKNNTVESMPKGESATSPIQIKNQTGAQVNTPADFCNTQRSQGLFCIPDSFGSLQKKVIVLSSLDEKVRFNGNDYELGKHKYASCHFPKGDMYVAEVNSTGNPSITYTSGPMVLRKTIMLAQKQNTLFVKYELIEGVDRTEIQITPFIANRFASELRTEGNSCLRTKIIKNGVEFGLNNRTFNLFIQVSKKASFASNESWNKNNEYDDDRKNGLEYKDDLFTPGQLSFRLNEGESVIVVVSQKPILPDRIESTYNSELSKQYKISNVPFEMFEDGITTNKKNKVLLAV
jgi:predicted glycogen debranching enzyme